MKSDYLSLTRGGLERAFFGRNPATYLFGGSTRSSVTCATCGLLSHTTGEIFHALNLPITGCASVEDALALHFRAESMHGDNAYACPRCGVKRHASKRLQLHDVRSMMVVQLKRFDSVEVTVNNEQVWVERKDDRFLSYPLELDFTKYATEHCAKEAYALKYRLNGVIVHSGNSATQGHYYSFLRRNGRLDTFALANDSTVTPVSSSSGLDQQAYLVCNFGPFFALPRCSPSLPPPAPPPFRTLHACSAVLYTAVA